MSQTMATKHMAALEERLGVKLLHRTTRQLTLTEAGRKYLDTAERILADIEDSEAEIGIDRLRATVLKALGPEDRTWYWSSRVRLGVV